MSLHDFLAVGTGGFVGALMRYGICAGMQKLWPTLPASGTFVVNVVGCGCIGFLFGLAERNQLSSGMRLFLMTGMLGSLTTFSTFGLDTVNLASQTGYGAATANVLFNLVVGVMAVCLGIFLAGR